MQRGGDDDLIVFFFRTVDGDVDLAVSSLDLLDVGVESGLVLQVLVQLLPDVLRAVLPGPQVDLDEVHGGLEVEVLQDVGCGDLVEVAVAEGSEGSDPDILDEFDAIHLAELVEGHAQILQVGVLAGDGFSARGDGIAFVAAFRDASVAVQVVALILGLQQFAELLDLLFHLEQAGDLEDVFLRFEGFDDLARAVLVVAVEFRAVVGDAAEFFHVVDGIVGGYAHDSAHLIAAAVVGRGPALAADAVEALEDGVVLVSLLLEIHACGETGGAAADDADTGVLVH